MGLEMVGKMHYRFILIGYSDPCFSLLGTNLWVQWTAFPPSLNFND